VNCQLYSGWRLGKGKLGIVPDGEGLVEAAGESIEVRGVRLCGGLGVSACKGDGTSVVDFAHEAFGEEAVGVGKGGGSYVRKGGGCALCEGVWGGDPNLIPRRCPYIGVLPSTLTARDSYLRIK